jgi:type I restriction enzyme S subunit
MLRSPACRRELRIRAKGIVEGFWRLYTDDFYDIRLPVPPLSERHAILEHIRSATSEIDRVAQGAEREIALLREYRTRLVADVVTGKLDVREMATKLPDHPEELAAFEDAETTESDDTADEAEISAVVETGEDN